MDEDSIKQINIKQLYPNDNNPYPVEDLEDLIQSTKMIGLEQNLVVKDNGYKTYTIVTGHKRYNAIKNILRNDSENKYQYLSYINCKVIEKEVNDIITNIRKHESNLQARPLLKLPREQQLDIIEDFIYWVDLAKKEGILIGGKKVVGTKRGLISKHFNISEGSAQSIINELNGATNDIKKEKVVDSTKNLI